MLKICISVDLEKYAQVKKEAANKADEDRDTYLAIKQPVVDEILAKALLEKTCTNKKR